MPATKYSYTISTQTANGLVEHKDLKKEIQASSIATALDHIESISDTLDIWFVDALSAGDQTTLTNTVSAHGTGMYDKTLSQANRGKLKKTINDNGTITTHCKKIKKQPDGKIRLFFSADISGAEMTELDTVISNHTFTEGISEDLSVQELSSAPTATDDCTEGFCQGDHVIVGSDIYECTDPAEGAAVWVKLTAVGTARTQIVLENGSTNSTAWTELCKIVYDGSSTIDLTELKVISSKTGSEDDYNVRVRDVTNGANIATVTIATEAIVITDLGTISNLPTGQAIFEIQLKVVHASDTAHVHALQMVH